MVDKIKIIPMLKCPMFDMQVPIEYCYVCEYNDWIDEDAEEISCNYEDIKGVKEN